MPALRYASRLSVILSLTAGLWGCGNSGQLSAPSAGGDTLALTTTNRLISFNQASPSVIGSVTISGLQTNETLLGLDIRPADGGVYALGSTGTIYMINTSTGAATVKSVLAADAADTTSPYTALNGTEFGVDFNPAADRLRVVSDAGQNLRINVDTGATTTDTTLTSAGSTRMGVTDAAYTNSFAAACRTVLYYIDSTTDRLLITADPNSGLVTEVGNLGVDAGAVNGFEMSTGSNGTNAALVALTVGGSQVLYTINLTNGAVSPNGTMSGLNTGEMIRGLAKAPPTSTPNQTMGNVVAVTESNTLISFNNGTPQKLCTSKAITNLSAGETVLGIDTRPANSKLYALTNGGRVYTINTNTAAATLASTLIADATDTTNPFTALDGTEFGVDFNPVPDRLRVVSDNGQNLRVNVDTGETITDTTLNPTGSVVTAAAYTNSFQGAGTTTLYVLDTLTDQLMIQGKTSGSPNNGDLTAVGSLGVDVQSIGDLEINAINNMALAAVTLTGATTSELRTIDLTSGAATRVNTIGGGERVRGLTLSSTAQTSIMAVTSDAQIVSFQLGTPSSLDTAFPITGLQGGESVVGIDYRPVNGKLYAVTDGARLYTLDPTWGGATLVASLTSDSSNTTPFTGFSVAATAYGVDFNPTVDRLRIVNNAGQNLRVNPDTGTVLVDTSLSPTSALVAEAGYTQNYAGAATTRLLDIDLSTGVLQLQNPPNAGTLTAVGQLSTATSFMAPAGFDIVGGDDGLPLAALQPTGATQSTLYRVNVTTGAVTAIAPIGPAGTIIRGLSIRLQ